MTIKLKINNNVNKMNQQFKIRLEIIKLRGKEFKTIDKLIK